MSIFSSINSRLFAALLPLLFACTHASQGRQQAQPEGLTLKECVAYALANHPSIAAANMDVKISEAVVGETKAIGLPQVNGQLQFMDNYKIQTSFLPAAFFAEDPTQVAPDAPPVPVQFGTRFMGDFGFTLSQLVFDGTYFLGLKAAETYTDLAKQNVEVQKADLIATVTKGYYAALIVEEQQEILKLSLDRIEKLLKETQITYENGFVEDLDVDRLQVTYNNLLSNLERLERVEKSTLALLKFQMGMDVNESIELSEKLSDIQMKEMMLDDSGFAPSDRPEYGLLQVQRELDQMNVRRYKLGYYPSVSAFVRGGFNSGSNEFNQYKLNGDTWFRYGTYGFTVNIPIFDGFDKKFKIKQANLELQKTELNIKTLENSFNLERQTSINTLQSSISQLETQSENRDLAKKVVDKTKIKYQQGVGSSLEVINAENEYNDSLNNYFTALYEALISKVDYDKAQGKLLGEYTPAKGK